MPNPKQSPPAIPSLSASDIDTAYRGARVVSLFALALGSEEPPDAGLPLSTQGAMRAMADAMRSRAERIAEVYETTDAMLARVPKGLFEGVSVLYPLGNPSPTVGNNPYPSALEGLYAEVRHALGYATHPARVACMDRPEGESEADWVRASWPRQSPEDERTRFAGLAAAMRAIATPHLRNDLERERRYLRAKLAKVAKPAEVKDEPDLQLARQLPEGIRDRLRQAKRRGTIRFEKRGRFNYYSRTDAKSLWPDEFPAAGKPA